MKNVMNKVIAAATMMMAFTFAMPVMADKKMVISGRRDHAVVVNNNRRDGHFDKMDKKHSNHSHMKTCVVKVSRHDSHHKIVSKAERMKGVMDAKWNPRTHEVVVRYDDRVTTAHHIRRFLT